MTKRILSFVVVLALVLSVLPVHMVASAEQAVAAHGHSDAHQCSEQCSGGTDTWTPWGVTNGTADTLPTASGHYYLEGNITLSDRITVAAGLDITICLNGYNVTVSGGSTNPYINGSLTIADCTAHYDADGNYISGQLSGSRNTNGGLFNVRSGGGKLVLESGKITGNSGSGGGGGAISLAGGSPGGQFYMYGGEITGNSNANGGGIVSNNGGLIYIYGGRIADNTATNKGKALYVAGANSRLTVSGSPYIDQVYFDNDSNPGLQVSGLTAGAKITVNTKTASAGIGSVIKLAGTQESWDCHWVEINGKSVSRDDNGFKFGHFHGTQAYSARTGTTLPSGADPDKMNYYYLAEDINRKADAAQVTLTNQVTICLNGHDIIHNNPNNGIYNITTGALVLEDGWAHTDAGGTYRSGGVTYGSTTASKATSGAVFSVNGGSFTLNAGQIYGFNGATAPVYAVGGAVTINGGQFRDNTASGTGGALYAKDNVAFIMTDGLFKNNKSTGNQAGAVYILRSTVNITGGTFEGNYAKKDAGSLYIHSSTGSLSNAKFIGNESPTSGSGLGFSSSSSRTCEVTVDNITVTGSKGGNGALLVNSASSTKLTISNSTIEKNNVNRGAVYILGTADVTLHNVNITGNTAAIVAGGLFWEGASSKLTVSGNTKITGNTCKDTTSNLHMDNAAQMLSVKDLTEGASIGISNRTGFVSEELTADCSEYFFCDNSEYTVRLKESKLYISDGSDIPDPNHSHCLCEGTVGGCDHVADPWIPWRDTDSLPASGRYYLTEDVTLTSEASISKDLTLCLNGHTITAAENKRILSTPKNTEVTVTITDCQGSGKLTGGVDIAKETGGGAIFIRAKGTLNLYGGTITGNKSISAGGGILLAADSVFNMYGGEISGNGARDEGMYINGAAIYGIGGVQNIYGGKILNSHGKNGGAIYTGGDLTIAGGLIEGNSGTQQGGGIYSTGDLTITGGQIVGNTAIKDGGGVYNWGGDVLISGGTISGNMSKSSGGGIGFTAKAKVTMTDGLITGNTSPNGGGMIVQGSATLELQGGQIVGNTSTSAAGGIYISTNSVFTMTGGSVCDNTAAASGGGIYTNAATVKISGGEVKNNTSVKDGGGLYLRDQSQVEISGDVLISGNETTKGGGGGVCFSKNSTGKISGGIVEKSKGVNAAGIVIQGGSSVEITDVTVKNNVATKTGAGIFVNNGTLKFSGGKVTGNTAKEGQGGGLYAAGSQVTITGGTFSYNTSQKDGGGVYFNKTTAKLSGMTITGNQSVKGAGGGFGGTKEAKITMTGGTVSYNKAGNAAGVIIQSKAHLDMYGGTVCYNEGNQGAGIYVNKASANLQGGTILGNTSKNNGGGGYCYNSKITMGPNFTVKKNESVNRYCGGLYFNLGTLDINGSKFVENTSKGGGSGFYTFKTECKIKDVYVADNTTTNSTGGGVVLSRETKFVWEGGVIENNYASSGGAGILIQNWAEGTITGLTVRNNTSGVGAGGIFCYTCVDANFVDCEIYGNKTSTGGAGVFLSSPRGSFDPLSYINFTNCKIYDNESGEIGAGVYISKQIVSVWTDCEIYNNTSGTNGGGMYTLNGSITTLDNVRITGNKSAQTGSALWIGDDFTMRDVTITGNQAQEGAAVNFPVNNFDGESYQLGHYTMSGDIIIADNQGTQQDLYIPTGTAIGSTGEGLGKNTKMNVQLESGILTNTILAEYDYEGGDLLYTVTYGDRSTREPEYEAPLASDETQTEQTQEAAKSGDTWLYVGIGAFVVAIIAIAAVVIGKKKKAKTPEASKE